MNKKPKIGIFKFTGCAGCQMEIFRMEDQFLDLLKLFEITYWKKIARSVNFCTGIYVVKLGKNLKVKKVKRVGSVKLNPYNYQNQQYLKNSYFAAGEKHKSL